MLLTVIYARFTTKAAHSYVSPQIRWTILLNIYQKELYKLNKVLEYFTLSWLLLTKKLREASICSAKCCLLWIVIVIFTSSFCIATVESRYSARGLFMRSLLQPSDLLERRRYLIALSIKIWTLVNLLEWTQSAFMIYLTWIPCNVCVHLLKNLGFR